MKLKKLIVVNECMICIVHSFINAEILSASILRGASVTMGSITLHGKSIRSVTKEDFEKFRLHNERYIEKDGDFWRETFQ